MSNDNKNMIPFKMHPRVFAALGADLVTNDVVAVIELVKNSYDAFAENVWIRFDEDDEGKSYVEIEDDGCGMTRDIIENVWCVVATPYRKDNPYSVLGNKKRRVSGEKGLGRLSVARLGSELEMFTKFKNEVCWRVAVNWEELSYESSMEGCFVLCEKCEGKIPFKTTGTILRIYGLKSEWGHEMLRDLRDNLSRMISPFLQKGDFNLYLQGKLGEYENLMKIDAPAFLFNPKYRIKGSFREKSGLDCKYCFKVRVDDEGKEVNERDIALNLNWNQIFNKIYNKSEKHKLNEDAAHCGSFDFEIRAWDLDSEGTDEIYENFGLKKSIIRSIIANHKGISVYRNGILALPKSDSSIDWLGLDLRRVSKVGVRMSTSQIVGYIAISAEDNPGIKDTSDREGFISSIETHEFEAILRAVVSLLENERDQDRVRPEREKPLKDLFEDLSTEDLFEKMNSFVDEGASASEAMSAIKTYGKKIDVARKTIQERFVYYSRMATVGTIAQMLIHEIRSRTTAFGSFLKVVKKTYSPLSEKVETNYMSADGAIESLESLADTFAPLANRAFRRRMRNSNLKGSILACIRLQDKAIEKNKIDTHIAQSVNIDVAVDPGELDAILLNLITNAVYWLSEVPDDKRRLEFKAHRMGNGKRIRVSVDDSGPGIRDDVVEKVMWPGITKKPDGIGMGLTVASELVAEYGGQMSVKHPGNLGGASFVFDLPVKK